MPNQKRTLEEWDAAAERRVEEASDGLKRIELARKRLPETVYAWACDILRFQLRPRSWFNGDLGAVIRLAADERMQTVWELLSLPRVDPYKALEYFQLTAMAPSEWIRDNSVIAEKRRIEKIADLCGSLESLLKQAPLHVRQVASDIVKIANPRDPEVPVGPFSIEKIMWGEERVEMLDRNQLRKLLNGLVITHRVVEADAPSLADCLRKLRDYCYRTLEAPRQRLPRKITQSSAFRTYVIRRLSKFMRQVLNQPYHEYVATTVVVALDLSEKEAECVDGDFVRKVTADQ